MASLEPRAPYTPEELAQLYPSGLQLLQVQVLLRHGERTPVNARFANAGLPRYWSYCTAAKQFRQTILDTKGSWDTTQWKRRLEHFGQQDAPELNADKDGNVDAVCQPGELTDRGRETTLALGQRLRRLYVEQLGFLPQLLDMATQQRLHVRSTPIPRALESVQQAYAGLYPREHRDPHLPPPIIVTRAPQDETLFPNEGACKRFGELAKAFAHRAALAWNDSPEMKYINRKIGKWMPEDSPIVKVDSHPRLTGVMDTINATSAHGAATRLPGEFYDDQVRINVDKICTEEWFAGYAESAEYRKLGIGALMGDIAQRMVEKVKGEKANYGAEVQMSLAGCHDTTLAAALASLGAFDPFKDRWPFFTSSIAFELFAGKSALGDASATASPWPTRDKAWWYRLFSSPPPSAPSSRGRYENLLPLEREKLDGYYVRIRYNDKPMTVPHCKGAGRHLDGDDTFCTLAAFKTAVDSNTPNDWKKECGMHLGHVAIPTVAEPPLGITSSGSAV